MAKRLRTALTTNIRGYVRAGIREGKSKADIALEVEDKFGRRNRNELSSLIAQERIRHQTALRILDQNKRRKVNLADFVKCDPGATKFRAYITISWHDKDRDMRFTKGGIADIEASGVLSQILNKAINQVRDYYLSKNYDIPAITSGQTSGKQFYRVEYIECV